jgi:hypothetical protein
VKSIPSRLAIDVFYSEGKYQNNISGEGLNNQNGICEIIAGAGSDPKNNGWVKIFKGDGTLIVQWISYLPGRHEIRRKTIRNQPH